MAPQRTAGPKQRKAAASSSDGPAARTRAATAQQEDQQLAASEMAWPLLLQHDSIRTQLPLACKLLCCSKALAAAVAEHSAGQLDMPELLTQSEVEQAAAWLRKHARLVRSLNLQYRQACVAALVAAGPQSLMLQSLAIEANSDAALPLLEQLPASCLTHLKTSAYEPSAQPQDQPAFVARLSAALGRLTALRSLELARRVSGAPLSGLSALTQLTALRFHGPLADLQHAPAQLLELDACCIDGAPPPLDLRHLAAVTALDTITVGEDDQLPPNLLQLQIDDCGSVQPLLPLVQLQQLDVGLEDWADITTDQLRQLSRLTALRLNYNEVAEPASAGAWPLLPLQQLELKSVTLSAPECQHLAQLTGLTSLSLALEWFQLPQAGSAQQLAVALRQLSGLQHLELSEPVWPDASTQEEDEEIAAGKRQLVQAIASLQRLRDLRCSDLAALAQAVAGASSLTGLTALTGLSLAFCDLTDAAVTAIVSQLPWLQSLDCSDTGITDAALPAIGQLQQLTRLALANTCVTDGGLQHLAGLTRLRQLDVVCAARAAGVTGAGMCRHLTGLVWLQKLRANREGVSQQQLVQLKQCLPDVSITLFDIPF